jgi:uncharacterized membrane protein
MALIMISVAYGIAYIFEINPFPVHLHIVLFIFSICFVLFSVFFERERGAEYPWSLLGGAIASGIFSFILTATVGGMLYLWQKGFTDLDIDTLFYALSVCIILSMILFNLAKHRL